MKRKSAKILLEKYKKNICKKKECILVDNEENFPEDIRNTNNASKITDLFAKSCRDEIVAKVVSWTIFPHHLHSGYPFYKSNISRRVSIILYFTFLSNMAIRLYKRSLSTVRI